LIGDCHRSGELKADFPVNPSGGVSRPPAWMADTPSSRGIPTCRREFAEEAGVAEYVSGAP
jgi:hypothetical protein